MERTMHKTILTGVAILAFASYAASAQDAAPDVTETLTADQRGSYEEWPEERRGAYGLWPPEHRTYYWTLEPSQQEAYWLLTEEQRAQIGTMTPAQRQAAWQSITRQVAAGANNSDTSIAARTGAAVPAPAQSANAANARAAPPAPDTAGAVRSYPGNLSPPPASAMNKTYPVCRGQVQDNCQNPGEGGAPGKSRALGYWPGKPASER